MAKQIWLYSCVDAGMSLSCWIWNRTPSGQVGMRPPYEVNWLVTILGSSCGYVAIVRFHSLCLVESPSMGVTAFMAVCRAERPERYRNNIDTKPSLIRFSLISVVIALVHSFSCLLAALDCPVDSALIFCAHSSQFEVGIHNI